MREEEEEEHGKEVLKQPELGQHKIIVGIR